MIELLEFCKQHFDKLLLTTILFGTMGFFLHVLHHGSDAVTTAWWENIIGQILAALLTLMVGSRLTQRKGDEEQGKKG